MASHAALMLASRCSLWRLQNPDTVLTGKASSYLPWWVLAGGHNRMQVKASYARPGKTHTQVTFRNKLYVSPRPLAEEFIPEGAGRCQGGFGLQFCGDLRTTDVAGRAGLVLRVPRQGQLGQQRPDGRDPLHDPENYFAFVTGTGDWARHEVTAQIPPDANSIIFGVFLVGRGQIELRNPQLEPAAGG
jgi:hypothetical protein